jgi:hypothetical protein
MMAPSEVLQPAVAGALLYLAVWVLWRLLLSPARQFETGAEEKAKALLREVLTEEEHRQLAAEGFLRVDSPNVAGRTYRIPGRLGWVELYESGLLMKKLCVLPHEGLPPGDIVLMHKLMIEGNEEEYLRLANVRWARRDVRLPRPGDTQDGQLAVGW